MTSPLPREWCRGPQWVSARARDEWKPVLDGARGAWSEIEIASITEGIRHCALLYVTPQELPKAQRDCVANGLELSVLACGQQGLRVCVHRPGMARAWYAAWETGNHDAIGIMLGFPECCREFFRREWVDAGRCDLTPAMGAIDGPWQSNIMLRWIGVRLVPHLPCSATCEATLGQAERFLAVGRHLEADVDSIESLLRLPVSHDALGAVAIVETPHFRFMVGTDGAPERVITVRGAQPSGPQGRPLVSETPRSWEDNGFSSLTAMRNAHEVLRRVVASGTCRSAIDLGCGDGALLASIAAAQPGRWLGIERDAERARRGRERHGPTVTIVEGAVGDEAATRCIEEPFDVALLMPGRLLEMDRKAATRTRAALRCGPGRIVVYAYGDWIRKHGSLADLAAAAGLKLTTGEVEGPGVRAACAVVNGD